MIRQLENRMDDARPPVRSGRPLSLEEETEFYRSAMVPRFAWLVARFFALTFTRLKPDLDHLPAVRKAANDGLVVYVMRNRSVLDYLFFNWYCLRHGLPLARFANGVNMLWWNPGEDLLPGIWRKVRDRLTNGPMPDPVDSGFMARTLHAGHPVLMFLRRPGSWVFRRPQQSQRDMVEELIRLQGELDQRIYLVPQLVMWERRPEYTQKNLVDLLFGERDNPGRLRKMLHFLVYHRGAFVRMGEPLDLRDFLEQVQKLPQRKVAKKLRLILRGYLFREKRLIKGPTVKPRAWLLDRIHRGPQVQEAVRRTAEAEGKPIHAIERRAEKALDSIAADYRYDWIFGAKVLFDFVLNRIYAGVEFREDDAERIRRAGRKGTIVFVPCHRSHLDYILISWCVFYQHLLPPHVAAGANLSFFPLGPILRRWGAFFLRRSFSDDELYRTLFSAYVRELVREGYPQEFFIEGTRSRTGALLPPKVGMLSMYLDAAAENVAPDVQFVPISLSYEKVVEEGEYHKELTGGDKRAEDIRGLASAPRVLARRYGRVYVRVGEALSAKDALDNVGQPLDEVPREERKEFLKTVGEQLLWEIHRVTPVTPSALAAAVLLSHDRRGMLVGEFHRRCRFLTGFLEERGAVFSNSLLGEPRDALDQALRTFADNKLVEVFEEPDANDIIAIVPERRMTMDYYKNNIINHLAGASLMAVALGRGSRSVDEVTERYAELRELLAIDLRTDPQCTVEEAAKRALDELVSHDVVEVDDDRVDILTPRRAAFFRATLLHVLESYLIALRGMAVLRAEPMSQRQLLDWLQKEGRKLYMTEDVTRYEAISKVALRNALNHCRTLGVLVSHGGGSGTLGVEEEVRVRQLKRLDDLIGDR